MIKGLSSLAARVAPLGLRSLSLGGMLVLMPSLAQSVHTWTPTPTISPTSTITLTRTVSLTYSPSPSITPTPTYTDTWSPTATVTLSLTVSETLTVSTTRTRTYSPSLSLTRSLTLTYSDTNTPSATWTPTYTVTPTFTVTPTGVLLPPTGLSATCGDKTVSLIWQGQPGHVVFNVYRGILPAGTAMLSPLNGVPQTAESYQDINLSNGTVYDYAVRGGDNGGSFSADSDFVFAYPAPAPLVPGPGNIQVSQQEGENILTFREASQAPEGLPPQSYEILRSDDGGNNFSVLAVLMAAGSTMEYRDGDIDSALKYWYTVRVSDGHPFCPHTAVYPTVEALPLDFRLTVTRNRINPDTGETAGIRLALLEQSVVRLVIYTGSGLRVLVLADAVGLAAGEHKFTWDGRNRLGSLVVPGIYLIHAEIQSSSGRKSLKGYLAVIR